MKKLIKPLILSLFLLARLSAGAQYFKPVWVNDIGGTGDSKATNIVADNSGNIYISGYIRSTVTFNLKQGGTKQLTSNGDADIYIAKYDMAAGNYEWAISMGGVGLEQPNSMTLDAQGNVLITGQFQSSVNFNPAGNFTLTSNGSDDIFVAKYTSAGNFVWAISMGGTDIDRGHYVATDSQSNVFITGSYTGAVDMDPSAGTYTLPNQSSLAGFFAKYDVNGKLVWAHPLGQLLTQANLVNLTVDKANNDVVVDGDFAGNVDFSYTGNAAATFNSPSTSNFVARYANNGTYKWVRYLPGSGSGILSGVKVDNQSNTIITGNFGGQFFANGPSGTALTASGINDLLVASYKSDGTLNWAKNFGSGTSDVNSRYVTIDPNNNIFVTGYFTGTVNISASLSDGVLNNNIGGRSILIAGLNSSGSPIAAGAIGGCSLDLGYEIAATSTNIYVAGAFCGTADFDTGSCNTDNVTAVNGTSDSFLASFTIAGSGPIANNIITAPNPAVLCGPSTPGTITASTPTGGSGTYTYQWQSSTDGVNFTDISGATSLTLAPAAINTTTYYRRVVSSTCAVPLNSNAISIQVQPALANNTLTAPAITSFCSSGDPANIVGTPATGGDGINYSYQWQSSTDGTTFTNIAGATSLSYDPPPISVTTYYRRVVTSGACTTPLASSSVEIIINAIPATPAPTATPVNICAGSNAALSVASPQVGVTYDWYDSPAKTNHLATGTSYTTNTLNTSQTFYIEATNAAGCTSASLGSVQVNVSSLPLPPTVTGITSVCSGTSATLSVQNPQAGFTYNWYSVSSGGTAIFTGTTFITPAVTGNLTYYADATNSGGCISVNRTAVTVTANPQPSISANGASICSGTTATLTATSSDNNASINWYTAATGGSAVFTGSSITTPVLNANTTYYAEAVDNATGCTSASRAQVQVQMIQPLAAPDVTVSGSTTSSVTFQWTAVSGARGYQISTDNGQTFTDPSSGSNGLTHTVSGLQGQESVTIVVRAIGSSPCELSANSAAVTGSAISPLGDQVFVPNAFTPNGDGKNDIFYVRGPNIRSLKFYVYDQWGELIYSTVNLTGGWDGTYKGSKEPVGVYVYYVEAIMNDGTQVNKKGSITLLR